MLGRPMSSTRKRAEALEQKGPSRFSRARETAVGSPVATLTERDLRQERLRAAARITRSGHETEMVVLLDSPEPEIRQHVADEVRRQRLVGALPGIRRRIERETDPDVRSSLALTLVVLARSESRSILERLLDDPDEGNRRLALRGLSKLGDESVIAPAVQTYRSATDREGKQEALDALQRLQTDDARTTLQNLLAAEQSWSWRRQIRRATRGALIRRHT